MHIIYGLIFGLVAGPCIPLWFLFCWIAGFFAPKGPEEHSWSMTVGFIAGMFSFVITWPCLIMGIIWVCQHVRVI